MEHERLAKLPPMKLPSPEEQEAEKIFRTYSNYTFRLSLNLLERYLHASNPLVHIATSKSFNSIQGGKCKDDGLVRKLLHNAWMTELQMAIAAPSEDLVPYLNHWAPIQLYYAAYLEMRAFFVASGNPVPDRHAQSLRAISADIKKRPELFLAPWSTLCAGGPTKGTFTYSEVPATTSITTVSNLALLPDFWSSYAMLLRTTRERQLDRAFNRWRKDNGKTQIPTAQKSKVSAKQDPTSIFDALYRLRVRSNYQDANVTLLTLENQGDARQYNDSLRTISWYLMLQLELLVARYLGKKKFKEIVDSFGKSEIKSLSGPLSARRWDHIEAVL